MYLKSFSNGRSLPVYGTIIGGSPNQALRSQVGLYGMTEIGYTQLLGNEDFVAVGQQLQLRSTVKSGDGITEKVTNSNIFLCVQ